RIPGRSPFRSTRTTRTRRPSPLSGRSSSEPGEGRVQGVDPGCVPALTRSVLYLGPRAGRIRDRRGHRPDATRVGRTHFGVGMLMGAGGGSVGPHNPLDVLGGAVRGTVAGIVLAHADTWLRPVVGRASRWTDASLRWIHSAIQSVAANRIGWRMTT